MKKIQLRKLITITLLSIATQVSAQGERWYTTQQLSQGKQIFKKNCASCHGQNAEAIPDWKNTLPNGKYPAPPLNGTAHAWHHSKEVLRKQVINGGAQLGGWMPAFKDKLTVAEIDTAIAYFQSKWTEEIYSAWQKRNKAKSFQPVKSVEPKGDPITHLLRQRLPGVEIGNPKLTEVKGLLQAKVGSDYAYLLENGRYVLIGDLIDLKSGRNLTREMKNKGP